MANKNMLGRIKPLKTDLIPPDGAVPAGLSLDGKHQLYTLTRRRSRSEPKIDPKTGEQEIRRDMNGQPLIRVRKPVVFEETMLFFLLDEGNGNIRLEPYQFPTPEEQAVAKRREQIAQMGPALAEVLVDEGVTPQELAALIRQRGATNGGLKPEPKVEPIPGPVPGAEVDYPVDLGDGTYRLSNGQVIQATEDEALSAEIRVGAVRQEAAVVPEV